MNLNDIIDQFKAKAEQIRQHENASVPLIIDQGRLMAQLRTKARKNWEETCEKKLKLHPRVARRYLKIGQKWSTPDRTPGSALLPKLPSDLQKLDALCELSPEQLKKLTGQIDLQKLERNEVIAKVKAITGKTQEQDSNAKSVEAVFDKWDAFVARFAKDVKQLDAAGQKEVNEELDDLVQQLREELAKEEKADTLPPGETNEETEDEEPVGEEEEQEEDGNSKDEVEERQGEEPLHHSEEEVPVPQAPATRGVRPAGRQRPRSQVV